MHLHADADPKIHGKDIRTASGQDRYPYRSAGGESAELSQKKARRTVDAIRARVISARERQAKRFKKRSGLFSNADMQSKEIHQFCTLDSDGEVIIENGNDKTRTLRQSIRQDPESSSHDCRSGRERGDTAGTSWRSNQYRALTGICG